MAFATAAVLSYLKALSAGLSTVQASLIAPPKSLASQKTVYVGIGAQTSRDKVTGVRERTQRYQAVYVYAVDGEEEDAELALAAFLDQFETAVLADRTLGGTVETAEVVGSSADDPLYSFLSAEEARIYPVIIETKQRQGYNN